MLKIGLEMKILQFKVNFLRLMKESSHKYYERYTYAIVRGRIKGTSVPIYAIWHCPLGLHSANVRIVVHWHL